MAKDKNEKEYLMIREEIMHYYNIIENLRNILYVSIAAILTFAISSDEPFLCMLPYCVIIPIYIITIDYQYGMWRMGTYLAVFLEGKTFNWERRLHSLNISLNQLNRHASSYNTPFVISSIGCIILFFLKIDYSKMDIKIICEICISILISCFFLIYIKSQRNPDDIKRIYIEKWKEIKYNKNMRNSFM